MIKMIDQTMAWVVFGLIILLGLIAIVILTYKYKKGIKQKPDYRTFFIMGIVWIVLGLIPGNYIFLIIGVVFAIIGLVKKKEWKKPTPWNKLSEKEKKYKKIVMIISIVLVLILLVLLYFTNLR